MCGGGYPYFLSDCWGWTQAGCSAKICRKTPKYSDYSSWNAYYEAYSVSIVNMRVKVKFMDFLFEFTDGKSGNNGV